MRGQKQVARRPRRPRTLQVTAQWRAHVSCLMTSRRPQHQPAITWSQPRPAPPPHVPSPMTNVSLCTRRAAPRPPHVHTVPGDVCCLVHQVGAPGVAAARPLHVTVWSAAAARGRANALSGCTTPSTARQHPLRLLRRRLRRLRILCLTRDGLCCRGRRLRVGPTGCDRTPCARHCLRTLLHTSAAGP